MTRQTDFLTYTTKDLITCFFLQNNCVFGDGNSCLEHRLLTYYF